MGLCVLKCTVACGCLIPSDLRGFHVTVIYLTYIFLLQTVAKEHAPTSGEYFRLLSRLVRTGALLRLHLVASFPGHRPAFRCLQYGKAGRAWYIFSREHDVIEKWQNFQNEDATFCVLFSHLHVQRSVSITAAPR